MSVAVNQVIVRLKKTELIKDQLFGILLKKNTLVSSAIAYSLVPWKITAVNDRRILSVVMKNPCSTVKQISRM